MTRHIQWIAVALFVAGCAAGDPTTPSASAVPVSAPASGAVIALQPAPADLGCDTIGVDYREVTFHVDPTAAEQVTAIASTGTTLDTFWAVGFRGGSSVDKTVLDPTGVVVVTDGEKLAIPAGAFPRLKGYFVCPSPDALYILAADPQ